MTTDKLPAYGIPDDVIERLERQSKQSTTYKHRNADKWREYMKLYMRGYRRKRKEMTNGI